MKNYFFSPDRTSSNYAVNCKRSFGNYLPPVVDRSIAAATLAFVSQTIHPWLIVGSGDDLDGGWNAAGMLHLDLVHVSTVSQMI